MVAARQPRDAGVDWPKVIFSAKEALHKCISPVFGTMLDFVDVTLDIDAANLEFSARLARPAAKVDLSAVRGRFAFSDTFVFACAFIPSSDGAET